MPSLKDKAMQLEAAKRKNEKLGKQASLFQNVWFKSVARFAIC